MKQRRTIVIIGGLAVLFVIGVTAVAVYFIHALQKEKGRLMTEAPRKKRWAKDEQQSEPETKLDNETPGTTPLESDPATL